MTYRIYDIDKFVCLARNELAADEIFGRVARCAGTFPVSRELLSTLACNRREARERALDAHIGGGRK